MWPSPGHPFSCTVRGPAAVAPAVAGGSTANRHRGWPRWPGYRGLAADASALWTPGVGSPRYAQVSGDREPTADLYATRLYLHQTDPRWEGGLKLSPAQAAWFGAVHGSHRIDIRTPVGRVAQDQ